jgi:nicotinate-nucleotide pyrophosphorylase (carboxylating)
VQDALEACEAGADIVMLDNFTADTIGVAAMEVKARFPHILVEASGVRCKIVLASWVLHAFNFVY